MAKVYDSILDLVGKTPLVELKRIEEKEGLQAKLIAKVESFNPAGSVKDRIAKAMIEDAEAKGLLKEGSVIIEPTSGNTGIGLAAAATVKGYRMILTMPETMSVERRNIVNWGWNNCTIQREEYLENRTALDDKYESIKDAFNNNIKEDHVYDGFNFDSSNVSTQFAAVEAAIDNYYNPLINGLVDDVDASIDAMNAAMDSAGIQDILDEMNRQAAEYVAEKEVK